MRNSRMKLAVYATVTLMMSMLYGFPAMGQGHVQLSRGATLYVPIYSSVYSGPKKSAYQLAAMLSIRNTDPARAITISRSDYYDEQGKKIEGYIKEPVVLGPLASTNIYIKEFDERGGTGASFIVEWSADTPVNPPVVQGIMLGFKSGQGVSFLCPARVIQEHSD